MTSQAIKINSKLVEIGMYVCKLDRPWDSTPFPIHGFYVRELNEVKQLKVHCDYLYIDPAKGTSPVQVSTKENAALLAYRGKLAPIKVNVDAYSVIEPMAKEMPVAKKSYEELLLEIDLVMIEVLNGSLNTVKRLIEISNAMVSSFIRNPDAFIWLVRVRKTDNNPYYYLIRSACWAILLGRHLGLSKVDLRALSISLLLKDIGQLQLSKGVQSTLATQQNNVSDMDVRALAIDNTVDMLRQFSCVHPKVIKIVKMHGERLNGSGFPQQLQGDQIFLLSKIASIASYYDRVTYRVGAKCATPASQSVSRLYSVRGVQFQDELVVEFIQAIGLYPTGTLVKLTNQEIAVVAEQNYERRLKPKVLVVVDAQGEAVDKFVLRDLYEYDKRHQASVNSGKNTIQKLDIVEDIEPYKYPIRVSKMREYYLAMNTKKSFFSMFK